MRIWLVPSAEAVRAISLGIEPEIRVATARQSAPVSGVARCACPFDIMRTAMSMSAGRELAARQNAHRHRGRHEGDERHAKAAGLLEIRRDPHRHRGGAADGLQLGE